MQHTMVTFLLHRKGVILLALGEILLGSLLFMAGCLVGQRQGALAKTGNPASRPQRFPFSGRRRADSCC